MTARLIAAFGIVLVAAFVILVKKQGKIPDRVRYFNKRVLNRVMMKFAGSARSPLAIVRHRGRRSGKIYQTPVILGPVPGGFVFALTYGDHVDWYRNILAAGECAVVWRGKEYELEEPQVIGVEEALPAFAPPSRVMLKIMDIRQFFRMKHKR